MLQTLRNVVGIDEGVLVLGLILLTVGAWPCLGRTALMLPGIVLIWMVLPQRAGFVKREPTVVTPRKRQ